MNDMHGLKKTYWAVIFFVIIFTIYNTLSIDLYAVYVKYFKFDKAAQLLIIPEEDEYNYSNLSCELLSSSDKQSVLNDTFKFSLSKEMLEEVELSKHTSGLSLFMFNNGAAISFAESGINKEAYLKIGSEYFENIDNMDIELNKYEFLESVLTVVPDDLVLFDSDNDLIKYMILLYLKNGLLTKNVDKIIKFKTNYGVLGMIIFENRASKAARAFFYDVNAIEDVVYSIGFIGFDKSEVRCIVRSISKV